MAGLSRADRAQVPLRPYPLLLTGVALQRLAELALSRRNERHSGRPRGTAAARSYPLMVGVHVALFALPLIERRLAGRRARREVALVALAGETAATALRLWAIRALGTAWNVRGRVFDDLRVVDTGPYRYVRHPNYVAVALEMLALPLAGGAVVSAIVLSVANAVVLLPRIREEEALLAMVPGYNERMAGKPRFLPQLWSPATGRRPAVDRR
jgi:methyltransferase